MHTSSAPKNRWSWAVRRLGVLVGVACVALLIACDTGSDSQSNGHNSGNSGGTTPPVTQPPTAAQWEEFTVKNLDSGGLTAAHVTAKTDAGGLVHIAYFGDGQMYNSIQRYELNYLIWNPVTRTILNERQADPQPPVQGQEGLDNCRQFGMDLTPYAEPTLVYQGGEFREAGFEEQSDVMISMLSGNQWYEGTGAMGYVERNPVIFDGWAGPNMDVAVDSNGFIHTTYQFYYEGVDADNLRYPDVFYTQRPSNGFDQPVAAGQWAAIEEQVDGNQFVGQMAVHNSTGYFNKIVLDANERPAVFYAEHTEITNVYELRVARRTGTDQWTIETIDTLPSEWEVGGISAALSPNGTLGVAYYMVKPTGAATSLGDHLKYAELVNSAWVVQTVDETSWCGRFCALTFDPTNQPAIAYFDERSHGGFERKNLRYAIRTSLGWQNGTVAEAGTIGWYNSIWFDANSLPNICTYSESDDRILIYRLIPSTP